MRKPRPRKAFVVGIVTVGISVCAWICWPGGLSYVNYLRVEDGMSRERVAELLGPGEETTEIAGFSPDVHLPGAPDGWTGVVWGQTFVRWQSDYREVYVGFSNGRVTSKIMLSDW